MIKLITTLVLSLLFLSNFSISFEVGDDDSSYESNEDEELPTAPTIKRGQSDRDFWSKYKHDNFMTLTENRRSDIKNMLKRHHEYYTRQREKDGEDSNSYDFGHFTHRSAYAPKTFVEEAQDAQAEATRRDNDKKLATEHITFDHLEPLTVNVPHFDEKV